MVGAGVARRERRAIEPIGRLDGACLHGEASADSAEARAVGSSPEYPARIVRSGRRGSNHSQRRRRSWKLRTRRHRVATRLDLVGEGKSAVKRVAFVLEVFLVSEVDVEVARAQLSSCGQESDVGGQHRERGSSASAPAGLMTGRGWPAW